MIHILRKARRDLKDARRQLDTSYEICGGCKLKQYRNYRHVKMANAIDTAINRVDRVIAMCAEGPIADATMNDLASPMRDHGEENEDGNEEA